MSVSSIHISEYPTKRVYYVGETYDPTGLVLQVIDEDGNSTFVSDTSQMTFSGFDSSEPTESQTVTITYMGVSTSIEVEIKAAPTLAPTLTAIEVYNMQTVYTYDFWTTFGPETGTGRIRCYYSDGSIVENVPLTDRHIVLESIDWDPPCPGTTTVTVSYTEDGINFLETQVEITIVPSRRWAKLNRDIVAYKTENKQYRKLTM